MTGTCSVENDGRWRVAVGPCDGRGGDPERPEKFTAASACRCRDARRWSYL